MAKEIRIEMKDGSVYDASKRVELTDEQLAKIQGGVWDYASKYARTDAWDRVFQSGKQVVWRENGCVDHWAYVIAYTYCGDSVETFDLEVPAEGFSVYGVPADQVLMEFQ